MICFFCKQKSAYEMRISDWSSDVCSSDLFGRRARGKIARLNAQDFRWIGSQECKEAVHPDPPIANQIERKRKQRFRARHARSSVGEGQALILGPTRIVAGRSEEHTYELQSLMRISYAVFCLKKKTSIQ